MTDPGPLLMPSGLTFPGDGDGIDRDPFPNVKPLLVVLLSDLGRCGTVTPKNLEQQMPFIRVTVYGGSDNDITDLTRVDIDVFAATEKDSDDLAETVRQRLVGKPHLFDGAVLDRVKTDTRPHQVSWTEQPPPWRSTAAYSVSARR